MMTWAPAFQKVQAQIHTFCYMWTELWNTVLSPRGTGPVFLTKDTGYWEEHSCDCVLNYVIKSKENYTG